MSGCTLQPNEVLQYEGDDGLGSVMLDTNRLYGKTPISFMAFYWKDHNHDHNDAVIYEVYSNTVYLTALYKGYGIG